LELGNGQFVKVKGPSARGSYWAMEVVIGRDEAIAGCDLKARTSLQGRFGVRVVWIEFVRFMVADHAAAAAPIFP
jgi:hypothetical protein